MTAIVLPTSNMRLKDTHEIKMKCFAERAHVWRNGGMVTFKYIEGTWMVFVNNELIRNVIWKIHPKSRQAYDKLKDCKDTFMSITHFAERVVDAMPKQKEMKQAVLDFFMADEWINIQGWLVIDQIEKDQRKLNELMDNGVYKSAPFVVERIEYLMQHYPDLDFSSLEFHPDWTWHFRLSKCLLKK